MGTPDVTVDSVMSALDEWVSHHGDGTYTPAGDRAHPENSAIQQIRGELVDFVEVLLTQPTRGNALEIGMGPFGGSHYLWGLLYDTVFTIENTYKPIGMYREEPTFNPKKDGFFYGSSHDPYTVFQVHNYYSNNGRVDFLFIDGSHDISSVWTDYLLYSPLVKAGGIIAFHDVVENCPGGPKATLSFISQTVGVKVISKSPTHCGIGWFVNGG